MEQKEDLKTSDTLNVPSIAGQCDTDYGAEIAYEAARLEYEYCQVRSGKLDNKVYIMLTVCAFLFVTLIDVVKQACRVIQNTSVQQWSCEQCIFAAILIVTIVLFIIILLILVNILSSKRVRRLSLLEIIERDLMWKRKPQVVKYICLKYAKSKYYNDKLIDDGFKKLNWCIHLLGIFILLLPILIFLTFLFLN